MTLNQVYYFRTVAKYENYRKAAEKLYISQPSLSRSMASLEEELGVLLFEKSGRGIALTKAGKLFLEYAERIIGECEIAKRKVSELASDGGKIDIGYIFPLAGFYIPHNVRNFLNKEENKNVTFSFYQGNTMAIADKVQAGELDVGFGACIEKEVFEYVPILSNEIVLITPKGHELEGTDFLSIQQVSRYPMIGYDEESWLGAFTRKLYENLSITPNVVVECPDEHSIAALVAENFGVALIPKVREIDESRLNVHRFHDVALMNHTYMFWMKDRYQLPALERFINHMKQGSCMV